MPTCENIAIFTAMLYSMDVDDSKQGHLAACYSTLGSFPRFIRMFEITISAEIP